MNQSVTLTVYKVTNYETNITTCGNTQNFLMLQHVVYIYLPLIHNNNNNNNNNNHNSTTADGILTTAASNNFWTVFSSS
jgi:hypothetical protein